MNLQLSNMRLGSPHAVVSDMGKGIKFSVKDVFKNKCNFFSNLFCILNPYVYFCHAILRNKRHKVVNDLPL